VKRVVVTLLLAFFVSTCSSNQDNSNTTATSTVTPPPSQKLTIVGPPQQVLDQRMQRGEMENAKPVLKITAPAEGSTVQSATVQVRLELSGDLKGYQPHKDPSTGSGNHIHVILDNNPYEAYYDLSAPFELKNVVPGKHVLRVFASRPWHESYKNDGSFQMVTFDVQGAGDARQPTTTGSGQTMADNRPANSSPLSTEVDASKPLLTYSRPKGEYKGADADPIMIDFWLTNAKLKGDRGEYLVRYIIDDDEPRLIDKWEPIWLSGWTPGKHTVRLELLGPDQYPAKNGSFNITTREIMVLK
jgi:hypothetical protein